MRDRVPSSLGGRSILCCASCRRLSTAIFLLVTGCASQQQTGRALAVAGTAAVVTGAIVASGASCARTAPDPRYGRLPMTEEGCRVRTSGQNVGAAIAVAGLGAAALGKAIEDDARRAEAWKRGRSSTNAPMVPMQAGLPANSLLALPEPPFTPRNPQAPQQPAEPSGASSEGEASPSPPAEPEAPSEFGAAPVDQKSSQDP